MAKEKYKLYYTPVGIELKSPSSNKVASKLEDETPIESSLNFSFCFNSSTISELTTIEKSTSPNSNDLSFSKNIMILL